MNTFRLIGELPLIDDTPSHGRIVVTPSVLPLFNASGELIAYESLTAHIDAGEFEIDLPANVSPLPFLLNVKMKLNSGVEYNFVQPPLAAGVEHEFDFATILPTPPGGGGLVEDPNDPGTFLPGNLVEDPADPGTFPLT